MVSQSIDGSVSSDGLFLFTRYPVAGCTKTRLIPALGATGAADLQRQMTEHLVRQFQSSAVLASMPTLSLEVHFAGGSYAQMLQWLGSRTILTPQCEGDLGARLIFALSRGFAAGKRRIALIGSDCPALGGREVQTAMDLLADYDVAIGPAMDGGYYLIAMGALHRRLFEGVPWGTDRVMAVTRAIALENNLSVALLAPLADIDRPEDLHLWESYKKEDFKAEDCSSHQSVRTLSLGES